MTQARAGVDRLVARHGLDDSAAARLDALLELLARDPGAPSSIREPHAALDAHLADSLVALELESVRSARAIADLGSGAGFPGLPLAVALPDARVWLVESTGHKCDYLARALRASATRNAAVACTRVEAWEDGSGACDLVVARALAPLAVIAEYAAPLLTPDGTLVAWKGRRDRADERRAAAAAAALGLAPTEVARVHPFPAARDRYLHLYSKVSPTPERFPRRAGAARKRPLGAD
ncbi:MAG: rRNA (guanine527-N7)-methyltransferase [Solirubrobacteraceae bacterium]|nr:rRNA (guanine527-N7)-methyltransferase [Solirubrobacteraceae bacterium]